MAADECRAPRPHPELRVKAEDVGRVLSYGDGPQQCDIYGARDVWVYEDGGTYYMHYDAAGPTGWLAALATSTDLTSWTKHGPVLDLGAEGEGDSKSASYGVTYKDGNAWHMFYLGTPNTTPPPERIPAFPYLTMKAKGEGPRGPWVKQKDVVPFRPKPGTYYSDTASPGHVVKHGDEYLQFFSASTKGDNCIWRTLSIARTKNLDGPSEVQAEPILPLEEQIENSSLYFEPANQTWFLFTNHIGITPEGAEYTDAVYVYWSKDLEKWDRQNKAVVLDGENCTWSKKCIGLPSVVPMGNRLAVFYDAPGGNSIDHMKRDAGLAWVDLPLKVPGEISLETSGTDEVRVVDPGNGRRVSFAINASTSELVHDEPYKLEPQLPHRWGPGTHLKGCVTANTLPGCLDGSSVQVRLKDGTLLERQKDYLLDVEWAGLARVEGGRISTDTEVLVTYGVGQRRIDSVMRTKAGHLRVATGSPHKAVPVMPELPEGATRVANIYMPYHAKNVQQWQVFPIGPPYKEPGAAEMQERAAVIPRTLEKLRNGDPLTIVTWGDSVTVGGDTSVPEKAYAPLFITRLKERFPKASIKHVNAGIGGTNTDHRLPGLTTDVLSHKPDLVTIEFVNDMDFPEEKLRANYANALTAIKAVGAEVILITPHFTMPTWMHKEHPRGGETRPAVDALRKIAKEHAIGLADASKRWAHLDIEGIPYVTLLANGINHPDDRGHELFVKELLTFFPAAQ